MRKTTKINQNWQFAKRADFSDAQSVTLPHTWNATDGQDGGNDYWRGQGYYRHELTIHPLSGHEYWLQFDAVAQRAQVFVNGQPAGRHDGGYSAFRINVTELIHDGINQLQVIADNLPNQEVYPQKADFTFYGGITRDVYLIETESAAHFALSHFGDSGIKITPHLADDQTDVADVEIAVQTENTPDSTPVTVQIGSQTVTNLIQDNQTNLHLTLSHVHRWQGIDDPYLYTAHVVLGTDLDSQLICFGCRTFRFDPERGFMLNGQPYRLIGAAKHEDYANVGSAVSREMEQEDCEILREMGGNAFRLAHYQHSDYEYQLADELGIAVWAEIPMITQYMPTGDNNAKQQLQELICQNWNHASIICWTLSNEITVTTGVTDALLACHRRLNDLAHQLDDSRPTCIANAFMLEPDSPLLKIPDLRTYNLYYGWYVPGLDGNDDFLDQFHHDHPDMVMGLSEFGADNNPKFHSNQPTQGDYSEEYATILHDHMLKMWSKRPWLAMMFPWTLFDFGADGREEGGKPGQNQKGLVTIDRRIKKDSFYAYKAYLSQQPFVHLCGHRFVKRPAQTTIKVYSNLDHIQLFINDKLVDVKSGQHVFEFKIDFSGQAVIRAQSGDFFDQMTIIECNQPVAEYSNGTKGAVTNWFDQDADDPNHYSLNDSINDLKANPKTAKIYQTILQKAQKAFGDVAKNSKMPPAMEKKMNAMPLAQQLKMASSAFKPGELEQFNRQLQQIHKP